MEDFSRHVSRFPDVVRYGPGGQDGEELPLGFTGPLQPLKRHPVIRSKQDEMSSEARGVKRYMLFFSQLSGIIFKIIVWKSEIFCGN